MALAAMIAEDEDALVCDLCETYGIVDYTRYTLDFVAILALGLPDTSRIKSKLAGLPTDSHTLIESAILDRLNLLIWMRTKDGAKNRNRPPSIVTAMYEATQPKPCVGFDSGDKFMAARQAIMKGISTSVDT